MTGPNRNVVVYVAALMFLAPLKWVTPVVLATVPVWPRDGWEWALLSWPNELGLVAGLVGVVWLSAWVGRRQWRGDGLSWLPAAWLGTQIAALPGSICWATSVDTVWHFAVGVTLFYLTACAVRDAAGARTIFGALGLAVVLHAVWGLEQWWGGLEATRRMAETQFEPQDLPPELWLRLTSERVFGAMVYPNALAGLLVLGAGPLAAWIWVRGRLWNPAVRAVAMVFGVALTVGVLLLTGSRGGLLAFVAAVAGWVAGGVGRRRTLTLAVAVGMMAAVALAWEAGLLRRGTASVSARFDYWTGAWSIAREHVWLGTGPGTFGSIYPKYKTGQTEEAQMAHNNFLQMWSDSGLVACVLFAAMWLVACRDALRLVRERGGDVVGRALVAAMLGWTVHGLVDFDLYVPGLAWPAFVLMGLVQGLKADENRSAEPVMWRGWRRAWLVAALGVVTGGLMWCGRSLMASYRWSQAVGLATADPVAAYRVVAEAAQTMPSRAFYHSQAGTLAGRVGRWDEAVEHWQAAVAVDPMRSANHWWLAMAKARARHPAEEVVSVLRQAVQLHPTKRSYADELARWQESVRQGAGGLLESAPNR